MPVKLASHPFIAACYASGDRHRHAYRPPPDTAQRCTCGNRAFNVTVGGPLPPQVSCDACSTMNRMASAYERGRASIVCSSQERAAL